MNDALLKLILANPGFEFRFCQRIDSTILEATVTQFGETVLEKQVFISVRALEDSIVDFVCDDLADCVDSIRTARQ